jgi:transcriptional regulator with XRE-family HTH domain
VNKNLFKAALAKEGYTQERLAKEMSIGTSTLIRKVKNNSFTMAEAERIVEILNIRNPSEIFFDNSVT